MSKNSRSKVHANYKARHRVRNWAEYDQTLVQRGDLTIWFTPETLSAWQPRAEGLRGGQRRYSDVAIETALTLRVLYRLPWRQTEGLLRSILELSAPDHTTLSRRAGGLQVELRRLLTTEPVHLIVDATGLGIVGQGQWAAAKWGERGRRGWRKLHIAVDESGRVLAAELSDRNVGDAEVLPGLVDQVHGSIRRLTADGGYDTREVYAAAVARGASVIVPPRRDAVVTGEPVFEQRDRHVERIAEIGRKRWRVEAGQHAQARAENTFSRYKRLFGSRLRARGETAQRNEALTGCRILNRIAELGMPRSERIATV